MTKKKKKEKEKKKKKKKKKEKGSEQKKYFCREVNSELSTKEEPPTIPSGSDIQVKKKR